MRDATAQLCQLTVLDSPYLAEVAKIPPGAAQIAGRTKRPYRVLSAARS